HTPAHRAAPLSPPPLPWAGMKAHPRHDPLVSLPFALASKNQLQRKLNLPRGAGRVTNDAKPGSAYRIRRQPEIHNVEQIEKLRSEFQNAKFIFAATPKR